MGGGIDVFRAKVEIYNSVMIGNFTTDTSPNSGFGGAITWNYFDRPDFLPAHRRHLYPGQIRQPNNRLAIRRGNPRGMEMPLRTNRSSPCAG